MRSNSPRTRQTASATTPQLMEDSRNFRLVDRKGDLLRLTEHKNAEIKFVARQLHVACMRSGQRQDLAKLVDSVRQVALDALEVHPDDLPEIYKRLGNPNAEPRRRLVNRNLEQDVDRVSAGLHAKWQRAGVRYDREKIAAFVRKTALDVLNTHPDDLHEGYRALGNPKVSPERRYPNYVVAENCVRARIRFAPQGTDFMPVRTLVIADPVYGWSRVRVLANRDVICKAHGGVEEVLTVMTAPSVNALIDLAEAMNLRVSDRPYLLSHPTPSFV